ncbi:MAG: ABC transporter substrate-binding protein, partial [Clostridia bacterium]|nr:ABC transporter substrate-binding protein [Clostridia bacterium]
PPEIPGYGEPVRVPLDAAACFSILRYENGDSLILTSDSQAYLITDAQDGPDGLGSSVTVIPRAPGTVYMAASAVMCFWDAMDRLSDIRFSALEADGWTVENARAAMEKGEIVYAGKYREPDYELLLSGGCALSIQSTMSEHVPKVKEKLAEIGIPVFVDRSSYEPDPLGRCEWVKVYAEIAGCPETGEALFAEQKEDEQEGSQAFHARFPPFRFFRKTAASAAAVQTTRTAAPIQSHSREAFPSGRSDPASNTS